MIRKIELKQNFHYNRFFIRVLFCTRIKADTNFTRIKMNKTHSFLSYGWLWAFCWSFVEFVRFHRVTVFCIFGLLKICRSLFYRLICVYHRNFSVTVSCIAIIDSHFLIQYFLFHCLSHTVAAYTQTIPHSHTIRLFGASLSVCLRSLVTRYIGSILWKRLECTAHTEMYKNFIPNRFFTVRRCARMLFVILVFILLYTILWWFRSQQCDPNVRIICARVCVNDIYSYCSVASSWVCRLLVCCMLAFFGGIRTVVSLGNSN